MALSDHEVERLFEIRKRSKQGEPLAPFELKFVQRCYDNDPEAFQKIESAVFEQTKPFGSQIEHDPERA